MVDHQMNCACQKLKDTQVLVMKNKNKNNTLPVYGSMRV